MEFGVTSNFSCFRDLWSRCLRCFLSDNVVHPVKYLELQQDQETRHHEHKNIQQAYHIMDTLILRQACVSIRAVALAGDSGESLEVSGAGSWWLRCEAPRGARSDCQFWVYEQVVEEKLHAQQKHHQYILYILYIHTLTYINIYTHTYIHTCMHACMHAYTPLHYITLHCTALHCIALHYITYRQTDIQTYRHTYRQTYRHTYRQTYRHTDIHTCMHACMHTYTPLHYITLHYIPLHCIALHRITLHT